MSSPHSPFWYAVDYLDAPYFTPLACPTCRANPGDYCTRGSKACQSRVDAGLLEAKRMIRDGEV